MREGPAPQEQQEPAPGEVIGTPDRRRQPRALPVPTGAGSSPPCALAAWRARSPWPAPLIRWLGDEGRAPAAACREDNAPLPNSLRPRVQKLLKSNIEYAEKREAVGVWWQVVWCVHAACLEWEAPQPVSPPTLRLTHALHPCVNDGAPH